MMNINTLANSTHNKVSTETSSSKKLENYNEASQASVNRTDIVEISSAAYKLQSNNEKLSATSGKDSLEITRGNNDNTFVIHFLDSAIVSRTIARGYITVNEIKIELSDEVKNQLSQIDSQAQADREKAYNAYIMQHEMAVAQQQGEVYKKVAEDFSRAFKIAAKISRGKKVSSSDEKALLEFNPQLYAMAKNAAIMAKRHKKQENEILNKSEIVSNEKASNDKKIQGVDWSSFDWKSYETQMNISLAETPEIQKISEKEIDLNT